MVVDFSKIDLRDPPVLILKNSIGKPIGILGAASGVNLDIKYNETSSLDFSLPFQVDGSPTPYYNSVVGMRIVDVSDVGQFILVNPEETGDGVKKIKVCKGYSLEYEFTFKKITLEKATYNFWNPAAPGGTLLEAILELMPTWSIGYIDDSLIGKYRTFEVADTNLYSFIKSTVQQSYNCVFDFDTYNRKINVRDASSIVPVNPVYISNANLAKEIKVVENTENIVTRLDVNGAEGVNIRDVNPTGTNTLINLDYFMNTDNFDQELIDKYYAWKSLCSEYRQTYYNLSIEYSLAIMRKTTESVALTELENELTSLENQQAVIIQAIALGVEDQTALDEINEKITTKQDEIGAKRLEVEEIQKQVSSIYDQLKAINNATKFDSYFTDEEKLVMDMYIKDDSVSESSFVATEVDSYSSDSVGNVVTSFPISISNSNITLVTNSTGKQIFDIQGGRIVTDQVSSDIVSAAAEVSADGAFVMSAYLGAGKIDGTDFTTACLSLTGMVSEVTHDLVADEELPELVVGANLSLVVDEGYLYFTYDVSEYEKRSVSWELFKYGEDILNKISQPSYTFSITSANFLCLDDFVDFKNSLCHGEKIYVGVSEDETLSPICIGTQFSYDSIDDFTLEFSDTYTSSDSAFLLADLLEQSVSMGKNVDLSKYTYSAFIDSGASTSVRDFMNSALDVSKNAIISTKDQAITWSESGIRLRKWTDESHSSYDSKQVWLNNNSIMMTKDNWSTAELAIGNFYDDNLGECWGVVAPNIAGTLIAGNNLVIESEKKDGDTSVFKVDADGCIIYNSQLDIVSANQTAHIALDPQFGIAIGQYPVYKTPESAAAMNARSGAVVTREIDEDNARFWVDTDGNLHFDGNITARSGYIGDGANGWTIGSTYICNGKESLSSNAQGIYIGTDGISIGDNTNHVKATKDGKFVANSATIVGDLTAKTGMIGGFSIDGEAITYSGLNWGDKRDGLYIGPKGIQLGKFFQVDSSGNLSAHSGTFSGNVYAGNIQHGVDPDDGTNYGTFSGSGITSGTVTGGKIASGAISRGKVNDELETIFQHAESTYAVIFGDAIADDIACDQLSADEILLAGKKLGRSTIVYVDSGGSPHTINVVTWNTGGSMSDV